MKKLLQNLLLVVIGIIVSALAVEGVLRIIGYSSPSFYTYDKDLGVALRAGAEGMSKKEGKAYVKINSDGLRDVEHKINKPEGVYRIAILGDSYAEGKQVNLDKLFWKVLERKLQDCTKFTSGKIIEVINFGVSGYGTGMELLMLRKKIWKYQPDLVILAFLTENDIRDNSKILNKIDYIPYFELDNNNELILDRSFLDSASYRGRSGYLATTLIYPYINSIRLLQLINDARNTWKARAIEKATKVKIPKSNIAIQKNKNETTDKDTVPAAAKQISQNEINLDSMVYIPPKDKVWRQAWAITEALIIKMNEEITAKGADFLIVVLSNGAQVTPDQQKQLALMKMLVVEDLYYPDFRIRDFAAKQGIETLILAPKLSKIAVEKKIFMHGFENTVMGAGHWNENGHSFAGELISENLCHNKN